MAIPIECRMSRETDLMLCVPHFRFSPSERGCYFEGELGLKYLPRGLYRYGISNCLFEATYEKVLEICRCTPYFHWAGIQEYGDFCRGKALKCMNDVFTRIGEFDEVDGYEEVRYDDIISNSGMLTTTTP